ncbi:MAG: oxygen-independent coproporphyrinogen III oxidase [Paralcaligenes sp.]
MRATALETDEVVESLSDFHISEDLVRRFDVPGPRYTSYPTADRFHAGFSESAYIDKLRERAQRAENPPLSVYAHLPFCESLCYFCACNKIITQDHSRSAEYVRYLGKEAAIVASHLGPDRKTTQLHFGGGTPTFLSADELRELMAMLRTHFDFTDDAELSVEIDPRTVTATTMSMLAELGFNRTSFGVQDFDPDVQQAIHRIQPFELVETALLASRDAGFRSINADLIYGLPKQSLRSFSRTLDQLIRLAPDRIALYNYAHLPDRFKAQRLIKGSDLPSLEDRLQIFLMSVRRLCEAGYVYIGLDHFARPNDELNRARLNNSLHRNFQGYTTQANCDLVGLGISAIGKLGASYCQSIRNIHGYYHQLDQGRLATEHGFELDADDQLRYQVIMNVMCGKAVDFTRLNHQFDIDFTDYFSRELSALEPFIQAALVDLDADSLQVTAQGRLFVRAIAMVFDRYLAKSVPRAYSRLV